MRKLILLCMILISTTAYSSERWYEDNNLGFNGGVPHDFIDRVGATNKWKDSRNIMHVYYLRFAIYRDYLKGNSQLMTDMANLFNEHGIIIAFDDTAAVWAHSEIKNKDINFVRSINALNDLLSHGFDVKYVGLQSVLSKPLFDSNGVEHYYSMNLRYKDVSVYFDKVRPHFPDIKVGIIDALPAKVSVSSYKNAYAGLKAHLSSKGYSLDFLHLDLPMSFPRLGRNGLSFQKIVDVENYVKSTLNASFGFFITDDDGGKTSSQKFSQYVLDGLDSYLNAGGRADAYVLSAWYPFPDYSIPDSITTNPPTGLSIFRSMDQSLNFHKINNSKSCFYDVRRTFDGANHDVIYPKYMGTGSTEGIVFRAFCSAASEKKPLYNCTTNGINTFVSARADCEGRISRTPSIIGYVYKKSGVNRKPIYRCKIGSDHFVTKSYTECSKYTVGGILGYTE